ncbi:helix-turn-helix domain-containing protein [Granulicella tundricola]|uniref:Helix-turn-helix domain protein n=1 Tax=Granulicella tundricola (strain ATCC BAA-1859 / DSM 23138 / MP5ACTX9) TaxID=1198114 RepID=E8WX68_GRATM|nr:helix-turn-helix domain protein [Granulicella tundricola MP5ACTX9]
MGDVLIPLGQRIRDLRIARGWRQIDLAEHSGVHEVHLSLLERGKHEVGVQRLKDIVTALDSSLSEILKGL